MSKQITISLIKIMNWNHTQNDTKLQISFLSTSSKGYIAHKSITGNYIDNTILLNTSFRISYRQNQKKIICKVAIINKNRNKQSIGQAEIDLQCFFNRKIQYVPFTDREKVIEIHRVDDFNENAKDHQDQQYVVQRDQQSQHTFLQQRYNFLDKITSKEIQLKKNFSQKVYNLLKDIKYARAADNLRKQFQDKKNLKDKIQQNQFQGVQKQQQQRNQYPKRFDQKGAQLNDHQQQKNSTNKGPKPYKLMIDSIQAYGKKQGTKQYNIYSKTYENNIGEQAQYVTSVKKGGKQARNIVRL